MIIVEKKLKIIFKLNFLTTFKLLKIYLNFTNWMRNYVLYYVQFFNSLQIRKIFMFKNSSTKDTTRKRFNNNFRLNISFESELKSYQNIQKVFFISIMLIYHDRTRQLYVDVNALHEREFDTTIFHVKNDKKDFFKENIELILFLNKIFTSTKTKYWSTELKIANFV